MDRALGYWATEQDYRVKCAGCLMRWLKVHLFYCLKCNRRFCESCWEEHQHESAI